MRDPSTRASLLTRMRDPANEPAWREFDELYRDLILRWCRRSGLQRWDAEDVRQVVMMSLAGVLRRGFRYQPEMGRFRDYLGRTVRHAIHARRRGAAQPLWNGPEGLSEQCADARAELDEAWEQEWQDYHLRRALGHLRGSMSERNRELFEGLLDGVSPSVLAQRYGLSEPAVRKVKQRVLAELREQIVAQVRDEDAFES